MSIIDESLILSLKSKHPGCDLHQLGEDDAEDAIIVRTPSLAEWKTFKAMARDENKAKAMDATWWLVKVCTVHPEAAGLKAIVDRMPARVETWGNKLAEFAGIQESIASKKL